MTEEPADFDAFWWETLDEARRSPLGVWFKPEPTALKSVKVFDVGFAGWGGQTIRGWLLLPANADKPLPCVVEYVGYGGGRGLPHEWLAYASAGWAHFVMDTRGQGSAWRSGVTPDLVPDLRFDRGGHHPGFFTRGILHRSTYYYRRLYIDAVRAVEAARTHPEVDSQRFAVAGVSQGGGVAIAVAGLVPDLTLALPDVPGLCHVERALSLTDSSPYNEITTYLGQHRNRQNEVLQTLSYFDAVWFARRARAKALFSVALKDEVCPPQTVYAAYDAWTGPKDLKVYPYNGHEGGEEVHLEEKLAFLQAELG